MRRGEAGQDRKAQRGTYVTFQWWRRRGRGGLPGGRSNKVIITLVVAGDGSRIKQW